MKLILQIALGVTLGIMLSAGILLGGTMMIFVSGLPSTQLFSNVLKQPAEHPLVKLPELPAIPIPSTVQPSIQAIPAPPVATKTAAEIEAQQQQLAAQEEKRKKDAAFKNWYHKSPECLTPNEHGHDRYVACGNEYARAKAKFEEVYRQGKL